jgi:hypothetical protein
MRTTSSLFAALFVSILGLSIPALAQERHAVSPSALAAIVAEHGTAADRDRDTIRRTLARPEVRAMAERAGIDPARAASSIDSLDAPTLARAAESARQIDDALVGGANTITVSTTTIILVLLLVILLLIAAK